VAVALGAEVEEAAPAVAVALAAGVAEAAQAAVAHPPMPVVAQVQPA
jgi:hypothetical protein